MKFKSGISFIGAGNMASAIINGILNASLLLPSEVSLYDPSAEKRKYFADKGLSIAESNIELSEKEDILILAVKPQVMDNVLHEIKDNISCKCIVSIAAGISIEHIRSVIGREIPIVRVLPNTPMLTLHGMTVIAENNDVPVGIFEFILNIFKAAGEVIVLPEEKINEAIPLSSSSPAFFFRMLNAMALSGEKNGIPYEESLKLAAVAMAGSAQYLLDSKQNPKDLIKQVSSPGGTTVAALSVFDEFEYEGFVDEVMGRCIKRAYELGASK